MGKMDSVNEKMMQMRMKTGGYRCPKCGNTWHYNSSTIRGTQIKGFFRNHPAWHCNNCGHTWQWTD